MKIGVEMEGGQSARVIIIGAGFAGVSAARALAEGGVDDVIILEAQKQAGGRVQKVKTGKIQTNSSFLD